MTSFQDTGGYSPSSTGSEPASLDSSSATARLCPYEVPDTFPGNTDNGSLRRG
jgi:hypothetical protein